MKAVQRECLKVRMKVDLLEKTRAALRVHQMDMKMAVWLVWILVAPRAELKV